ncbi:MAG: hypothetical protein EU547_06865 [Promethearchaeota archaeon]|nr:MAG: hypothetical protein EU547_06865 [Candidatus Lokiarchaeota archaeon]
MELINAFYERVKGSYFGFIAVLISLTTIFLSIILYIQVDPTFSFFTEFISFLGIGPNNSDIVFNIGIIIAAPFMLIFYVYLGLFLISKAEEQKRILNIALIAAVFNLIGYIILAVFNNDLNLALHLIGAYIAFGAYFALACIFSYVEMKISNFNRTIAISGFIPCILLIGHIVLLFLLYYTNIFPALPIFIEWMMFFIMMGWILLQAIYIHLLDKKD